MTDLKKALEKYYDRKALGGFRENKTQVKDHFPPVGDLSREVVLKLNADVTEEHTIFNINFPVKTMVKITGEIADHILREFGQYLTVVAATAMYHKGSNTTNFYEIVFNEDKGEYKIKVKGSQPVLFDESKLKLMSYEDRQAVIEADNMNKKALEVEKIARINALAMEKAKANNTSAMEKAKANNTSGQ